MKIVEEHVWWEFTCSVCGSVIQAEPTDVTGVPNVDCDGDKVGSIPVVACGHCGKEHNVPANKLTPLIEQNARLKCR